MRSTVRQFFLLSFLFQSSLFLIPIPRFDSLALAATEYLPPTVASDSVAQQTQVNELQRLLPFSQRNTTQLIQIQNVTLDLLRARFPNFDQWASEKPDPITINIYKKSIQAELTYLLREEHYKPLQQAVLTVLSERLKPTGGLKDPNAVSEFVKALKTETLTQISRDLLSGADSVRGFITGLLQALPAEKRGEIFKVGEPLEQLKLIENSGLTNEQLRAGRFQAERFGLDSKTMTVPQVLEAIRSRMNTHQSLLVQLGLMAIIERGESEALNLFLKEPTETHFKNVLQPQDFRFFDGNPTPFLVQLTENLVKINPIQEAKIRKSLEQALAAVPKAWFERRSANIETNVPFVRVIEVHPYLAVYRGCVGGDCSTSHSPMYPFSPWEHDFYISMPDGTMVGYISATRVLANGKPSLYLKDITGRTLSPEIAEVVIHAFSKVYKYYGVENYLLANPGFTNGQNHFPNLKLMLAKYNGYNAQQYGHNKQNLQVLNVSFPDAEVRNYIQATAQMASTASYDSPSYHPTGTVFVPDENILKQYNVDYKKGTLSPFKPNTPRESLLHALRLLSADPDAKISEIPGVVESEVKAVFVSLKNPSRLSIANYYQSVENTFKKYGIELSRSFRQSHENFFIEGHLNSSDAMNTAEDAMKTDTERFFITYCRRFKSIEGISLFISAWPQQLSQMKRLPELMELLSSRAEDFDIALLLTFASGGYEPAKEALKKIPSQERIENVIYEYLFKKKVQFSNELHHGRPQSTFFFTMNEGIVNSHNNYADRIEVIYANSLASIGLSLEALRSQRLIAHLGLAWMQSHPRGVNEKYQKFYFEAIQGALVKKEISLADFYIALQFSSRPTIKRYGPLFDWRVNELKKNKTGKEFERSFEVYALTFFGQGPASEMLRSGMFLKGHLEILKSLIIQHKLPEGLQAQVEELQARAGGDWLVGYHAILQALKYPGQNLDQYYQNLERYTVNFGISLNQLLSVPELKSVIVNTHLGNGYAFAASTKEQLGRSFDWLAESILKNEDTTIAMQSLLRSLEQVKTTPQFAAFIRRISKATQMECTDSCVKVMAQLAGAGVMHDGVEFSEKALLQMLASFDPFAKTFAAVRLLEKNPKFVVSQSDLLAISKLLANDDEAKFPDSMLNFSEAAMDVLNQIRSNSEEIRAELLETIKEDENIRMVLKGAMAYIKNGGSVDDIKKYIRRALVELREKEKTSEVQRLLLQLRNLAQGYDFDYAPGSCQFVFAKAKAARKNQN